jgi:hypothetical protein
MTKKSASAPHGETQIYFNALIETNLNDTSQRWTKAKTNEVDSIRQKLLVFRLRSSLAS